MPAPSPLQVTRLLQAWGQGEDSALEKLLPLVHQELRRIARRYMYGERVGHTLQATALVNEAYLKLLGSQKVNWQNRAHFFAISAQLMRRILVDSARARGYQKRGAGAPKVTFDEALMGREEKSCDLVMLDDALKALAEFDPRTSTGLTVTAELDTGEYATGLTYTKKQVEALPIDHHGFHGDWNYTVRPEPHEMPVPTRKQTTRRRKS